MKFSFGRVSAGYLGPKLQKRVQLPTRARLQSCNRQVRVSRWMDGISVSITVLSINAAVKLLYARICFDDYYFNPACVILVFLYC